jgi:hypothetical protein
MVRKRLPPSMPSTSPEKYPPMFMFGPWMGMTSEVQPSPYNARIEPRTRMRSYAQRRSIERIIGASAVTKASLTAWVGDKTPPCAARYEPPRSARRSAGDRALGPKLPG